MSASLNATSFTSFSLNSSSSEDLNSSGQGSPDSLTPSSGQTGLAMLLDYTSHDFPIFLAGEAKKNPMCRLYFEDEYDVGNGKEKRHATLMHDVLPFASNANRNKHEKKFMAVESESPHMNIKNYAKLLSVKGDKVVVAANEIDYLSIMDLGSLTGEQKSIVGRLIQQQIFDRKKDKIKREVVYSVRYKHKTVFVVLKNSLVLDKNCRENPNKTGRVILHELGSSLLFDVVSGSFGKVKQSNYNVQTAPAKNNRVKRPRITAQTNIAKVMAPKRYDGFSSFKYAVVNEAINTKELLCPQTSAAFFRSNKGYMVMPRHPGEALDEINICDLRLQDVVHIGKEVARQLALIHTKGIHRDVKPENIIYCQKTKAVNLIDLGLFVKKSNNPIGLGGTPDYMPNHLRWRIDSSQAVRQCDKYVVSTCRDDYHSLLVTLAELFIGKELFSRLKMNNNDYNLRSLPVILTNLQFSADECQKILNIFYKINEEDMNNLPQLEDIETLLALMEAHALKLEQQENAPQQIACSSR